MANKYNSFVTTKAQELPFGPAAGNPLPTLTAGVDYLLDLNDHFNRDVIELQRASGSEPTVTLGPTSKFEPEDRPVLRFVRIWSNFSDGFVFDSIDSIKFDLRINNIIATSGGYSGSITGEQVLEIQLPALNTMIDIERFVPVTVFSSVPGGVSDDGGVSTLCNFMYISAFVITFKTDIIDTAFNGETPAFRIEAEVEHTFELRPAGAC